MVQAAQYLYGLYCYKSIECLITYVYECILERFNDCFMSSDFVVIEPIHEDAQVKAEIVAYTLYKHHIGTYIRKVYGKRHFSFITESFYLDFIILLRINYHSKYNWTCMPMAFSFIFNLNSQAKTV